MSLCSRESEFGSLIETENNGNTILRRTIMFRRGIVVSFFEALENTYAAKLFLEIVCLYVSLVHGILPLS